MSESRLELLKELVACEAKEAEWGSKASKIRKQICDLFAEFRKGNKVIVTHAQGRRSRGIVAAIYYNPTNYSAVDGFAYTIHAVHDDWVKSTPFRKVIYYPRADSIELYREEKI